MSTRVVYYHNGVMRDLAGYVKSIDWDGNVAQAYRSCALTLNNTRDGRKRAFTVANGGELRFYDGGKERFRGVVFEQSLNSAGEQTLKAHDYNVYLVKSDDTVRYVGKTATQIIRDLCAKYGIKTGKLADTRHVLRKFIVRGKSLYDIIVTALTETRKATGKRYVLRNTAGLLELVEVTEQTKRLTIENGRNLMSASYSSSIEDVRTRVKLTGGDENKPVTVEVSAPNAKDYGIMQHYEHNSDVKNAGQLRTLAQQLLAELNKPKQEFSIEALGDADIISGTSVIVKDAMTGITGAFYVSADTHKYDAAGVHTMALTLSRTLELPTQDYEAPKEEPPAKSPKAKKKRKEKSKKEAAANGKTAGTRR